MLGWFGKLLASGVLICLLSVVTTAYLVDQYVKVVLDQFQLSDIERPSLHLGDLLFGAKSGRPEQTAGVQDHAVNDDELAQQLGDEPAVQQGQGDHSSEQSEETL